MFLAAIVLHPQLVLRRGAQDIAFVIAAQQRHMIGMATVMERVSDVGPVRVALLKRDGYFGATDQRQVQAVGIARIGSGQSEPQTFFTQFPAVAVEQKTDLVAAFAINVAIGIVGQRAGDTGRHSAHYLRLGQQRRPKAHALRIGNRFKAQLETAVPRGTQLQSSDHRTRFKRLRRTTRDLLHLRQSQRSTAAHTT